MIINNYLNSQEDYRNKKMILIRGTASSGKTVLSAELGNKLKEYFLVFPIEDVVFFSMTPTKYLVNGAESYRGFSLERDEKGDISNVNASPWSQKLYETYFATLETYTQEGFNIICDGNMVDEYGVKSVLKYVPDDYEIYIFGLDVPLNILEAREKSRTERVSGFAKHQYDIMRSSYYLDDLTISVGHNTTINQMANHIVSYYENHKGHNKKEIMERFMQLIFSN
jgi:chloramphenicol 3-O-phosphotransferase